MSFSSLKKDLRKLEDKTRAEHSLRFFKTGKGEYGYGDKFLGIRVPVLRKIAKEYKDLPLKDIQKLLNSNLHEEREIALYILVLQFNKADEIDLKKIHDFYLKNIKSINNWDLVDCSAPYIMGMYLLDKKRDIIYKLAKSKNMWERRIAMLTTFAFINKNSETKDAYRLADILLNDKEDLIHKAVGWMLRETGKRVSEKKLEEFLKPRYKKMPRTMLRYAIEKFEEKKRKRYLLGKV